MSETRKLRVRSMVWEAEGILGIELVPTTPNTPLPAAEPGAHVDLHLGSGCVRSYSLTNPGEVDRWTLAVNLDARESWRLEVDPRGVAAGRDAGGRGPAQPLRTPRNRGAQRADRRRHRRHALACDGGAAWLRWASPGPCTTLPDRAPRWPTRSRCVNSPSAAAPGWICAATMKVTRHWTWGPSSPRCPKVRTFTPAVPAGMLAAFQAVTVELERERVHLEHFASTQRAATEGGYTVKLARDGRSVPIAQGRSILDALIAIGLNPPHSCREGTCGSCETRVVEGIPDHRDEVLTDAERAEGTRMMICCSGSQSRVLVLDL